MECAPDGDAMEYVQQKGGLPEDEARWFFQQIVLATDYLHAKGAARQWQTPLALLAGARIIQYLTRPCHGAFRSLYICRGPLAADSSSQ